MTSCSSKGWLRGEKKVIDSRKILLYDMKYENVFIIYITFSVIGNRELEQ